MSEPRNGPDLGGRWLDKGKVLRNMGFEMLWLCTCDGKR